MPKPFYPILFLLCLSLAGWGQVNTAGMEELDGTWETIHIDFDEGFPYHSDNYFITYIFQDSIGRIWFSILNDIKRYPDLLVCYDGEKFRFISSGSSYGELFLNWKGLFYFRAEDQIKIFDPLEEKAVDSLIFAPLPLDSFQSSRLTISGTEEEILAWVTVLRDGNSSVYLSKNHSPFQKIWQDSFSFYRIVSRYSSLYLGQKESIIELDTEGEIVREFPIDSSFWTPYYGYNGTPFWVDNNNRIWLYGCYSSNCDESGGLYTLQKGNDQPILKFKLNVNKTIFPQSITENLISLIHGDSLFLFDINTEKIRLVPYRYNKNLKLMVDPFVDQTGTIWVGGPSWHQLSFLNIDEIGHIPIVGFVIGEDSQGNIYVVSEKEIIIINPNINDPEHCVDLKADDFRGLFPKIVNDKLYYGDGWQFNTQTKEKTKSNYYDDFIDFDGRGWSLQQTIEEGIFLRWTNNSRETLRKYDYDDFPPEDYLNLEIPYQRPSDSTVFLRIKSQLLDTIVFPEASKSMGVLIFDKNGNFLFTLQEKLYKKRNHPEIRQLNSLYEDKTQNLWLAHDKGLSKISKWDPTSVQYFGTLIENSQKKEINSILPDDDNRFLWLVTRSGLYRFDTEKSNAWKVLFHSQLEKREFGPAYKAKDGTMYFTVHATLKNDVYILAFNSNQILAAYGIEKIKKTPIFFRNLNKFDLDKNKEVPWPDINLNRLKQITLKPQERFFSLEYALADYRKPEAIYYTHKLEGYDKIWSEPNKNANQIRYENLPPATYTLRMKASLFRSCVLPDGGCQERTLKVIILPFWYQTWWAWTLFIGIPLIAIFFFYQYDLKRQLAMVEAQRLQEMDSLKTRLYTNITHEFRTPLTVILGLADQVKTLFPKSAKTNLKAKEYLGMIRRNGQHLLRLINQLLDLAKLESGAMHLNFIQANVITFILYVSESFQSLAETKGVRLMSFSEVKDIMMDFDPEKLQDIISNLLSNAIKFTPEGGSIYFVVNTTQTLGVLETPRVWVLTIKIKDTGIGIPPDKLPFVFDRFYQVDTSTTREGEGTGIGLALTKELVNRMGGKIEVESELGKGTTFMVSLPIKNEAAISAPLTPTVPHGRQEGETHAQINVKPQPPAGHSTSQHFNGPQAPQLLIIEDNPDVVAYIQTCLEADYQIETARNGQIGIDIALEQIPDIIISDVMMPKKNGYEVCETLKNDERTSHIPIVLLTAKATQADKVTGLQTGADAYLVKPFDKEELLVRLEKLIALRRQLQARYAMLKPVKDGTSPKEDAFVLKLRQVVEEKMDDPDLAVVHLCKAASLSHMQVYRKLKALTNRTPSQFIRSIRLQKAFELLKTTDLTVSEVAYDVGFSDPNYFSRTFLEEFGLRPSVMRK